MSPNVSEIASAHGTLAALKRHHPQASDRIQLASGDLAAAKLAEYVRRAVESWPPLTQTQRERVAALLRSTADAA